jgi:acyl-coenzyme A synthetase/AMP-(fatty) acid ligase
VSAKRQLVDRIRAHAGSLGSATAVEQGRRIVTYAELDRLVARRASELLAQGVSASYVAIERRKSPEFVVDLLAVFALGGTIVPLDPDGPPDRRATFLDLVRPDFLLGDGGSAVPLAGDPARHGTAEGAGVYFTSGSTGLPKPVLGSADGLRTFIDWFCPEFGIGPGDRAAYVAGVSFEATMREVFPPLAAGAALVLPDDADARSPEATVAWLARARATIVTVVPSVARTWLRHGRTACPQVRAAFFIAEPLTAGVLGGWRATFPNTETLVSSYGSTESGQATICRRVSPGEESLDLVPAGRPVPYARCCLIDPASPLDPAVVRERLDRPAAGGEIVIVSRACSHGYLGLPEENAARFADLGGGEIAYRTGDLGRIDERGDLVVQGRVDDEVKVNGVRVHPAEVTRALRAHRAVGDAFVIATRAGEDARLTAFVVPAEGRALGVPDLRRDLVDTLPLAMIPARFVEVAELPASRTGKVDRAALVRLAEERAAGDFVAPSGDAERWVADRFAELFGIQRVSATDDLFALGGDSIVAGRLASRMARDLGVTLSLRAIFTGASVAGIAAAIVEEQLLVADPDELRALLDAVEEPTA